MCNKARAAYIHVPFCAHRCGYCNFTLIARRDDLIEAFLEAIERELALLGAPREVETLYLGGGTPTHLSPRRLDRLLEIAIRWHPLAAGGELTVEANPRDLNKDVVGVLDRWRVNRCSLGGQSLNVRKLRALERDHTPREVALAVESLQDLGIRVAMDLIFAAPGESLGDWQTDLDGALRLDPHHVSTYGLTYEKGTAFWSRREKGLLTETEDELQRKMYSWAIDRLTEAGFDHYEISNFARPGQRSRHNQVYWSGEPYYAAGPGAARYLGGVREMNHRSTTTWLRRVLAGQSPVAERDVLAPAERARELLVVGMRRVDGVNRREFHNCTGFGVDELAAETIAKFVRAGLMVDDGHRVRLTREGLFVSDAMWPELL